MQNFEIKFLDFGLTGRMRQVISLVGVRRGMTIFVVWILPEFSPFHYWRGENVGL